MRRLPQLVMALILELALTGCWADFPESRMQDGFGADKSDDAARFDLTRTDGDFGAVDGQPDAAGDGPGADQPRDGVSPGDQTLDGGPPADQTVDGGPRDQSVDRGNCPLQCDTCRGSVCEMACAAGCTCPRGWECHMLCGDNGCLGPIDCSRSTKCTVDCGSDACTGEITCSSGDCTINCGINSCTAGLFCGGGGFCDVSCAKGACRDAVDCSDSCGCSVTCDSNPSTCKGETLCPSACGTACGPTDGCDNC